jgi:spore coat polysaccharide biosynthesis protein SpsF (cytidylyltransferase family)
VRAVITTTIVQARLNSRRLPGKALLRVGDKTILQHVLHRLSLCDADLGRVVVATSDAPSDDALATHCDRVDVDCYRGRLDDVLDRFYRCAVEYDSDLVVRVTADCPLLCPSLLAQTVTAVQAADYAGVLDAPRGFGQEAFSRRALDQSWWHAVLPEDREHVVTWLLENGDLADRDHLKQAWVDTDPWLCARSHWNLSVDEPKDLALLRRLYETTGGTLFDLDSHQILAAVEAERLAA